MYYSKFSVISSNDPYFKHVEYISKNSSIDKILKSEYDLRLQIQILPMQNSVRIRYSFDPRGESILLVNAADINCIMFGCPVNFF